MPFPIDETMPDAACVSEETLHQYVDGELAFEQQPALFSHLAACAACRRTLESVLTFRRLSRQEIVAVPPAVDDAFFQRLDQVKRRTERVDRQAARRPLWNARAPVSLGLAAVMAAFLFLAGVMVSEGTAEAAGPPLIVGMQEQIDFDLPRREAVYVFYPGLTVEATKLSESVPAFETARP